MAMVRIHLGTTHLGVLTPEAIEERLPTLASLEIHFRKQKRTRRLLARGERRCQETLRGRRGRIDPLVSRFEVARGQTELARELALRQRDGSPR